MNPERPNHEQRTATAERHRVRRALTMALLVCLLAAASLPAHAQAPAGPARTVLVTGIVRDESNAITLPGVPIAVVTTGEVVYTDVDGRFSVNVPPGTHDLRVALDGYQEKVIRVEVGDARSVTVNAGLRMNAFSETVNVTADVIDVPTSSAEAQLIERQQAPVITDNVGAMEMKQNGDGDAAAAVTRVTGLSLVDNQYVYVRGLGERYSNTTLAGSVLPTTEPDKKVVPLDLFPTGLIDSVQVSKSYSPDRSAEFAGGLVQIVPMKLPNQPVVDVSYGLSFFSTATGKDIPLSPLGTSDGWGFDNGSRALPSGFPADKIVRNGIFTPDVGFSPEQMTAYGRMLDNRWRPVRENGAPGQNWSATLGDRFGNLGLVASITHSYKEQFIEEQRRFFRVADDTTGELEAISDYAMQYGTQRAQLGIVANLSYEFMPTQRLSIENFYTHGGRDEGRAFEGPNTENRFWYRNTRLQFIEEGLISNAVAGEHFFQGLSNSRLDWRVNYARATRDEPDLRETLYQGNLNLGGTGTFVLADESQSGFRMFSELEDDTVDAALNWSVYRAAAGRPTQLKFGFNYVGRTREFASRRFRFVPSVLNKDGAVPVDLELAPEELFTPANIGTAFRFTEETRPVDAYDGDQTTASGYGMVDIAMTARTRLIAGARVERFDQVVNTRDPFGLFLREIQAENENTDVFPGVNFVQNVGASSNIRVSYSTTVNRPEFRELAEFEFTDVVGSRAVRGNPDLERALIQNVDGRWETFGGGRGVIAASVFYKHFDRPIERVIIAGAQPIATYQNADQARNVGFELELGREIGEHFFVNANYTFVDSTITLADGQQFVQTSSERPLAGQSRNLFNLAGEFTLAGFSTRLLFNYFGDRIADVGANQAPDIIEQGRGTLDLVLSQRIGGLGVRLTLENLADGDYRFTQGEGVQLQDQRLYRLGRTVALSFGYNVF